MAKMFHNSFQEERFSSKTSYESIEREVRSKEEIDPTSNQPEYTDFDLKDALSKVVGRPKFIQEIEFQCSLNMSPSASKFEQKGSAENGFTEVDYDKFPEIGKSLENKPGKLSSGGEILAPNVRSFSSYIYSDPLEGPKKPRVGFKIDEEDKTEKDDSKTLELPLPLPDKKPPNKPRFSLRFSVRKSYDPINPNAVKLIHDKAFGPYEDEEKRKKQNLLRTKKASLLKIIKKHVDGQKPSKKGSLRALLGQVKEMHLNPFQRLLKFLDANLHKLVLGLKKITGTLLHPINPNGIFVLVWEAIIIALVFLDLFVLPFTFGFEDDLYNSIEVFEMIDTIQFSLYLLNILINLNTSYCDKEGHLILSRSKIIFNYLSGSLWIDVISSFPYRWTIIQPDYQNGVLVNQSFNFLKLLRFLRILRVFKVFRSNRILKRIEEHDYFNPLTMGVLSLLKLSVVITCLAHWCACIWYVLGTDEGEIMGWLRRANLDGATTAERYVASLYFAITTMLTVGYGDISPLTLKERIFGIFLMIIGGGLFGYTMTSIAEIIKSLEREESKKKKRAKAIAIYMQKKGLNKDLQERVKKYLAFVHENEDKNSEEDKDLLSVLSTNLKDEISKQINGKFINESPILRQILTKKLKNLLPIHLEECIVSPEELIYSQDDTEHSLYLISKGKVNLHYERFVQPLATLQSGTYFGMESFFTDEPRTVHATSVEFSHLIYITRSKFLQILENHLIDKETFSTVKDKGRLYNDYSSLAILCHVCNKIGHSISSCPDINFIVNKEQTIKRYLLEHKSFCKDFIRRNRKTFHVKENLSYLNSQASKIVEDLGLIDEDSLKNMNFYETGGEEKQNTINPTEEAKGTLINLEIAPEDLRDKDRVKRITIKTNRIGAFSAYDIVAMNKMIGLANGQTYGELFIDERYTPTQEELEFDRVKNYQIYFAHNNLSKIIEKTYHKSKSKSRFSFGTTLEGKELIERMRKVLLAKSKQGKSASLQVENPRSNRKLSGEESGKNGISDDSCINFEHPPN